MSGPICQGCGHKASDHSSYDDDDNGLVKQKCFGAGTKNKYDIFDVVCNCELREVQVYAAALSAAERETERLREDAEMWRTIRDLSGFFMAKRAPIEEPPDARP